MTLNELRGGSRFRLIQASGKPGEIVFTKLAVSVTPNGESEIAHMANFKNEFAGKDIPDAFTVRDDDGVLYPMPGTMVVTNA